jgi:hypothetical protein
MGFLHLLQGLRRSSPELCRFLHGVHELRYAARVVAPHASSLTFLRLVQENALASR